MIQHSNLLIDEKNVEMQKSHKTKITKWEVDTTSQVKVTMVGESYNGVVRVVNGVRLIQVWELPMAWELR